MTQKEKVVQAVKKDRSIRWFLEDYNLLESVDSKTIVAMSGLFCSVVVNEVCPKCGNDLLIVRNGKGRYTRCVCKSHDVLFI